MAVAPPVWDGGDVLIAVADPDGALERGRTKISRRPDLAGGGRPRQIASIVGSTNESEMRSESEDLVLESIWTRRPR